jgi:hypothetical protein
VNWFTTVLGVADAGLVRGVVRGAADAAREAGNETGARVTETDVPVTETRGLSRVYFDVAEGFSSAILPGGMPGNQIKE